MQLHDLDTTGLGHTGHSVHAGINKHAYRRDVGRQARHNGLRLFWCHIAWAGRIKDQADHVGPGLNGHARVSARGNPANLDFGHTSWLVVGKQKVQCQEV